MSFHTADLESSVNQQSRFAVPLNVMRLNEV